MKQVAQSHLDPLANAERLASPRFDDERTVQSARRVVPLAKISSKARRRFSLSAVTFLLVTLTVGMLIYSLWNRNTLQRTSSSADANTPVQTEIAQSPEAESTASPTSETEVTNTEIRKSFRAKSVVKALVGKAELPQRTAVAANVKQIRPEDRIPKPRRGEGNNGERPQVTSRATLNADQPRLDDRLLMSERGESRSLERPRRVRRARTDSTDDIFRIEEIFRGSTRP